MIKRIKETLQSFNDITDYLIQETSKNNYEAYYTLQKLEMTRLVETVEYTVTIYKRVVENEQLFISSAICIINPALTDEGLKEKIAETLYAASFVKNKDYQLVKGNEALVKTQTIDLNPFTTLNDIAQCFISQSNDVLKFNSLEIFYNIKKIKVVNSKGVDYTKTFGDYMVEAIPSYNTPNKKVELYKQFCYSKIDLDLITLEAKESLLEVKYRHEAENKSFDNIDIILCDEEINQLCRDLIQNYSYSSVYFQISDKKIGDTIQKDAKGDLLNISLKASCPEDFFDNDGVLLKHVDVVKSGFINSFYGSNRFAQYLNLEPTGNVTYLELAPGRTPMVEFKKAPNIEIVALSGIQIDVFCGYIGGEIRLALYNDGKRIIPITGVSFSGNLDEALKDMLLSKETIERSTYNVPKMLKFKNMKVI